MTTLADLIGGSNSDFATFQKAGVPGVEFAYLHGSPIYHTPADFLANISANSLEQHGANTLALVRQVGNLDLDNLAEDGPSTFFNFGPRLIIGYGNGWVVPLSIAVGLLFSIAVWQLGNWRQAIISGLLSFLSHNRRSLPGDPDLVLCGRATTHDGDN